MPPIVGPITVAKIWIEEPKTTGQKAASAAAPTAMAMKKYMAAVKKCTKKLITNMPRTRPFWSR